MFRVPTMNDFNFWFIHGKLDDGFIFLFTSIWGRFPIWPIFFKWGGSTTNYIENIPYQAFSNRDPTWSPILRRHPRGPEVVVSWAKIVEFAEEKSPLFWGVEGVCISKPPPKKLNTPSLPKSSKYLVRKCLEPPKAFSGNVYGRLGTLLKFNA